MIIIRFNLFNKVIEVVRAKWVDLVGYYYEAGRIMDRSLKHLMHVKLSGGFGKWCDVVHLLVSQEAESASSSEVAALQAQLRSHADHLRSRAEQTSGRVVLRWLNTLYNSYLVSAMGSWAAHVARYHRKRDMLEYVCRKWLHLQLSSGMQKWYTVTVWIQQRDEQSEIITLQAQLRSAA